MTVECANQHCVGLHSISNSQEMAASPEVTSAYTTVVVPTTASHLQHTVDLINIGSIMSNHIESDSPEA